MLVNSTLDIEASFLVIGTSSTQSCLETWLIDSGQLFKRLGMFNRVPYLAKEVFEK
jgi:hypothetical protein